MTEDIFYKKTISLNFWRKTYQFKVSQDLFSSFDIDVGTKFLIRTITEAGYSGIQKILDMGTGYGPLGILLGSYFTGSEVHMVDRDALAVDYAAQNAELNGIEHASVYPSLAYDSVTEKDFDLVVSNIPGKAGRPAISYLLTEAGQYLNPNGIAAVVVITAIKEQVEQVLRETEGIEVLFHKDRSGHSVYHYRFTGKPGQDGRNSLENHVYDHFLDELTFGEQEYSIQSAYGLPDLDAVRVTNRLTLRAVAEIDLPSVDRLAIFNPGQGQVPVLAWKLFQPGKVVLVDRDLLALEYSRLNLVQNGCPKEYIFISHQTLMDIEESGIDLAVISLREENREVDRSVIEQTLSSLSEKGRIIVTGSSTAITRLITSLKESKKAVIQSRERSKGNSVAVMGLPRGKR